MDLSPLYSFFRNTEFGLFLLRVPIGAFMILYGALKLMGGEAVLEKVGKAMELIGISIVPLLWGYLAACTELIGGILILIGFFFRPAAAALLLVMVFAATTQYPSDFSFMQLPKHGQFMYPLVMAIIFLAFAFTGPGKFSVQKD